MTHTQKVIHLLDLLQAIKTLQMYEQWDKADELLEQACELATELNLTEDDAYTIAVHLFNASHQTFHSQLNEIRDWYTREAGDAVDIKAVLIDTIIHC